MRVVRKIPTESKPDGNTYAGPFHKLYVSDERAKAVAVVDVRRDQVLTTLHFDSETGVPLYDPMARLVYQPAGHKRACGHRSGDRQGGLVAAC